MKNIYHNQILFLIIFIISGCGDGKSPPRPSVASSTLISTDASPPGNSVDNQQGDWWRPLPGATWHWQLTGAIDHSYDVDMYDIDLLTTSSEEISRLHEEGRIVICYFSAGSWEDWRSDSSLFPASLLGEPLEGWPDERWLDIRQLDSLGPLLQARLDLAVDKGCDGVEPDNVDGYSNNSGFPLSSSDQLAFNIWLAGEAHQRSLSIGLKNDLDQVGQLVNHFDWALNEQCFEYNECETLAPFIQAGKAVLGVEYKLNPSLFCTQAQSMQFSWMKKNWDLDAWMAPCW